MSLSPRSALVACFALTLAACSGGSDSPAGPGTQKPPTTTPPTQTPTPTPGTASAAAVAVTPASGLVLVGRTTALTASARDSVGTVLSGRVITWSSSADSIARVDASGVVTGVAPGAVVIAATSEGKRAEAALTVQRVPVASVVVAAPAGSLLRLGDSLALAATVRDDQQAVLAGRVVRWVSSAPAVASVDSVTGVVRGVSGGAATITATSEGQQGTLTMSVVVPVASVSVASALDTLEAWDEVALQATTRDARGGLLTGRTIRWTSSNPLVAIVDSITGVLTCLDRGTVTVTAISEGIRGSATRVVVIRYRSVSAGAMHACDIASGGIAWCWGLNGREGRIGMSTLADGVQSSQPVQVPGGLRFMQLSTFGSTTCGITRDARAYCWGYNGFGNLGNASSISSATPVAVQGGLTFRQISVGAAHVCGVTTDNRGYCWGFGQTGELGRGSTASSNVPVAVSGNLSIASISAGSEYTCAVTTSGGGQCWGYSGLGNLGDGGRISFGNTQVTVPQAVVGGHSFRQLSASNAMTCGLNSGGSAFCWGANSGRLGNGGSTETSTPSAVSGGHNFRMLSAGYNHTCGVTTADEVWCWGSNTSGQLGLTLGNGSNVPVRAGGSLTAAEVTAANLATGSASFTCAISADRLTTYCFGRNDVGQLGNGSTSAAAAINSTPSIVVGQKPLPRTR